MRERTRIVERSPSLRPSIGRIEPPRFLHHPLVRDERGRKLSKSDRDTGLRELLDLLAEDGISVTQATRVTE